MHRVGHNPGATTALSWQPVPRNFVFVNPVLGSHAPNQIDGQITIVDGQATPTPTPSPTSTPTPTATPTPTPTPPTVTLPTDTFDTVVDLTTIIVEPVITTLSIQPRVTSDSKAISSLTRRWLPSRDPPVQAAGLTEGGWTVSGKVFDTGEGTIKVLHVSAFSNDAASPLAGSGTLYELRMLRTSSIPGR